MKYYNKYTDETYTTEEELNERVYEETDDLGLLTDILFQSFETWEIWDMLTEEAKEELNEMAAQNYIHDNIVKLKNE